MDCHRSNCSIEPHICSLIEGEKSWKNNTFKGIFKNQFHG